MYQLYIANKNYSSWSFRPWLLLSELGLPFEEHLMVFDEGRGNYDAFRKFSPTGKVPCLVDGPVTVWDSLAIAEYLAERHPGVWPTDGVARAWARCAAAEMHSGFAVLRNQCGMNCGIRVRLHQQSPELKKDLARIDELWNDGLARFGGPFLAGPKFSAADAFFGPVAFRIQTYGLELSPRAMAYAQRLLGLASTQRWYQAALAEKWREKGHEEETLAAGVLLEDLRTPPG
ncbi:MAG: glutathione S-transferase family protein [Deltaproteobacteria bacterium]|jgi:glutathione S-transferase|nr:glutathione S-transferase family protein [Deltaproteobacteria bacterium]